MRIVKIAGVAVAGAVSLCGCMCGDSCCGKASAPVAKHVVLIGVDGMGARWIPWDRMPNLSQLRRDGLYAVGRDNYPTSSAINWATVFYGTVVEVHGYRNWNSEKPDVEPPPAALEGGRLPCIFSEIRRQDPSAYTASLYTWGGLGFCYNTNTVGFVKQFGGADPYPSRDAGVIKEGVDELAKKPKMILLYNGQPDSAGHTVGWGTPEFTNACARVDEGIGRVVEGLKKAGMWEDTVVMLVADHGGEGKKHGMANANCFDIPFLVSGPPVKGMRLREPVLLADTAPTIADLLGYKVPECWRGRPAVVER